MFKSLTRIIALSLIPCLLADPSIAAERVHESAMKSYGDAFSVQPVFGQEAFTARLSWAPQLWQYFLHGGARRGSILHSIPHPTGLTSFARLGKRLKVLLMAGITAVTTVPMIFKFYRLEFFADFRGNILAQDFARLFESSRVWWQYHTNPYNRSLWIQLAEQGKLDYPHPNPNFGAIGYWDILNWKENASPFTLWLFHFLNPAMYFWAYNIWPVLTLAVHAGIVLVFQRKLAGIFGQRVRPLDRWKAVAALVLIFSPIVGSAFHFGGIEGLYVPLIAGAIFASVFYIRRSPAIKGMGIVLATAIKPFSAAFLVPDALRAIRSFRSEGWSALRSPETKTLLWASATAILLAGVVLYEFPFSFISDWWKNLSDGLIYTQKTAPPLSITSYAYLVHALRAPHPVFISRVLGVILGAIAMLEFRRSRAVNERGGQLRSLLAVSTLMAVLPSLSPHFWCTYVAVYIIAFLTAAYTFSHESQSTNPSAKRIRKFGIASLSTAYVLLNLGPWLWIQNYWGIANWINPSGHLNIVLRFVAIHITGYPGTVILVMALLLAHRYLLLEGQFLVRGGDWPVVSGFYRRIFRGSRPTQPSPDLPVGDRTLAQAA